mmetsp:Transcript_44017/g.39253  ORF Transcript_44017/g.39253 Transcript_44017/m.39253 type:complete len:218 (-) Transcript_44017:1671-2324(-)
MIRKNHNQEVLMLHPTIHGDLMLAVHLHLEQEVVHHSVEHQDQVQEEEMISILVLVVLVRAIQEIQEIQEPQTHQPPIIHPHGAQALQTPIPIPMPINNQVQVQDLEEPNHHLVGDQHQPQIQVIQAIQGQIIIHQDQEEVHKHSVGVHLEQNPNKMMIKRKQHQVQQIILIFHQEHQEEVVVHHGQHQVVQVQVHGDQIQEIQEIQHQKSTQLVHH